MIFVNCCPLFVVVRIESLGGQAKYCSLNAQNKKGRCDSTLRISYLKPVVLALGSTELFQGFEEGHLKHVFKGPDGLVTALFRERRQYKQATSARSIHRYFCQTTKLSLSGYL